jgi:hypothetical protein
MLFRTARSCSLLGARHSSGAIMSCLDEDARLESRAPSHERAWTRAVREKKTMSDHHGCAAQGY